MLLYATSLGLSASFLSNPSKSRLPEPSCGER
jgi:hypothetical protein